MSEAEMAAEAALAGAATLEIPDKLYFRIGEVARLAAIKPYVLRFWESEFPSLGPKKSGTGHRLYRRKDVELVLEIKRLLYDRRYTIEGARKVLDSKPKRQPQPTVVPTRQAELFSAAGFSFYKELRKELKVGDEVVVTRNGPGRLVLLSEQRIRATLARSAGLWAGRTDIPSDCVQYVNRIRKGKRLQRLGVTGRARH